MSVICDDCRKPFDNGGEPFMLTCDECLRAEGARLAEEAANFRNPTPPPIPVRGGYYLTKCGHCGWIGSSEQCLPSEEDVVCPVCCSGGCEDEPSEKDTEDHGEAVMQRILAAEAARDRLLMAFHDAIRRPLGVTPDSGAEFYDPRMADEAEARRAALASPKAASTAWPSGCIKPNSCARNRHCMYALSTEHCRHFGKDLTQAVETAVRDREWAAAQPKERCQP